MKRLTNRELSELTIKSKINILLFSGNIISGTIVKIESNKIYFRDEFNTLCHTSFIAIDKVELVV